MATPKSGKTAPIIIDEHQLETLASIGCTMNEMAAFFKCSSDTISRNYAVVIARGREQGKVSVRRMLWAQGNKGNSVALKYLVHNVLKERIEPEAKLSEGLIAANELMTKLSDVSTETILRLVKSYEVG